MSFLIEGLTAQRTRRTTGLDHGRPVQGESRHLVAGGADAGHCAFLTLLDPAVSNRSSLRPSPGEAGPSPADAAGRDPEGEILAAAALLSAYRRAGRRPGEAPRAVPPAAEADVRPPCSEPAVEVLELILSGEVPLPGGPAPLAAEWLAGAARAGRRLPARLLPRLLELGWHMP